MAGLVAVIYIHQMTPYKPRSSPYLEFPVLVRHEESSTIRYFKSSSDALWAGKTSTLIARCRVTSMVRLLSLHMLTTGWSFRGDLEQNIRNDTANDVSNGVGLISLKIRTVSTVPIPRIVHRTNH